MAKIKIAGLDGSLRNFGVCKMLLDTETLDLQILDLVLVNTAPTKDKKVRSSSDNLRRAQELSILVNKAIADCTICFGEVPSGSQSYDAVLGFGIVIGVYGGLRVPFAEVSPAEVKMAAVGAKNADKQEMIEWAFEHWPDAPWLTVKRGGQLVPIQNNEHLADAAGAAVAGLQTPSFRQTIAIFNSQIVHA